MIFGVILRPIEQFMNISNLKSLGLHGDSNLRHSALTYSSQSRLYSFENKMVYKLLHDCDKSIDINKIY